MLYLKSWLRNPGFIHDSGTGTNPSFFFLLSVPEVLLLPGELGEESLQIWSAQLDDGETLIVVDDQEPLPCLLFVPTVNPR